MQRIQRKRTKGWKMPPNTIYVGRPTKWGNPFKLGGDMIYHCASHRRTILDPWVLTYHDEFYTIEEGLKRVVSLYEQWLDGNFADLPKPPTSDEFAELTGHDLACWCPLLNKAGKHNPCHVDILLNKLKQ